MQSLVRSAFVVVCVLAAACTSGSSSDEGTTVSATEETGDTLVPQSGVYEITLGTQISECRSVMELENWELTINLPEGDGDWTLIDNYTGPDALRQAPFPCNITADFAICGFSTTHDYNGDDPAQPANVTIASRETGIMWTSETEIEGDVRVNMKCEGSACDDIAEEWQVLDWTDCETSAEFTGVLKQ